MLFWLIFSPANLALSQSCPTYTCGAEANPGVCWSYTDDSGTENYLVTPCSLGLECPTSPKNSGSCTNLSPLSRYPGEFCSQNTDCISGLCTGSTCIGTISGQACSKTSQCNPGLYCSTKNICEPQISLNQPCVSTEQCVNNAVCDNDECILIYSLALDASTTSPDGFSMSCLSGYAEANKCIEAPKSSTSVLTECNPGSNCPSADNSQNKACLCGYNDQGYCPLFEGDEQVVQMISGAQNIYGLSAGKCHAENKLGYACFITMDQQSQAAYFSWIVNANLYLNNEWVLSSAANPSCVKQTAEASYNNLVLQSQGDTIQTCPEYSCPTTGLEDNQCIYAYNGIFYDAVYQIVQAANCSAGYECSIGSLDQNSTCEQVASTLGYPGDYCTAANQCHSGLCYNSACYGKGLNEVCSGSGQCSPGYYCSISGGSSGVCAPYISNGEACTDNSQCATDSLCILDICVKAYSLSNGEVVDPLSSDYGYSNECSSGFAIKSGNEYICASAPTSSSPLPIQCTPGSLCKDKTQTYTKECECGLDGNGYCPPFEGDAPLQNSIAAFNLLSATKATCSDQAKFTPECLQNNLDALIQYYIAFTNETLHFSYVSLQHNPSCFQNITNVEYWQGVAFLKNPPAPLPTAVCSSYNCGSSSTSETCWAYMNVSGVDTYTITPCVQGLECPAIFEESAECEDPNPASRYPGEFCSLDSDCKSNDCVDMACVGLAEGTACTSTFQCDVGFYCSSLICTSQLSEGFACTSTSQCVNSALCDNGKCVIYFSLEINNPTSTVYSNGLSPACITGYSNNGLCAAAPLSSQQTVTKCEPGSQCVSKNGQAAKLCECAFDGNGYCPLFEGDPQVVQMISGASNIYALSTGRCHTSSRLSYACFVTMSQTNLNAYLEWIVNAELYLNNEWVYQNNNSICVNQTVQASYNNLIDQNEGINPQCASFSCANNPAWLPNQCVFEYSGIEYSLLSSEVQATNCPSGFFCNSGTFTGNASCLVVDNPPLNPGDYCTSNTQCLSNKCLNHVCVGLPFGNTCSSQSDCNPGLYCNSSQLCTEFLSDGEVCSFTYECSTFSLCTDEVCTKSYSLPNGANVTKMSGSPYGYNADCSSGFAVQGDDGNMCTSAPVSPSVVPRYCTPGSQCPDSTGKYFKTCMCGLDGNGYCPPFEGDSYLKNAILNFHLLEGSGIQCSAASKLTPECFSSSASTLLNYYEYYTNLTLYTDYSILQNNLPCYQNVSNSDYWQAMSYINNPPNPPTPPSCPIYTCGNGKTTGECWSYSLTSGIDQYIVTPCLSDLICDAAPQVNGACAAPNSKKSLPGEFCSLYSDCLSNSCVNGICVAGAEGAVCSVNVNCNPGLYCSNKICTTQVEIGGSCTTTPECINSAVCDNEKCVGYYSKPIGSATSLVLSNNFAPACASGFSYLGLCASAPANPQQTLTKCTLDSECVSRDGQYSQPCMCGYDGNGYCPLFPGDLPAVQMISGAAAIYALSEGVCHTENRLSYACFVTMGKSAFNSYLSWVVNANLYLNNEWVNSASNSACINQTVEADYRNLVTQSQGYSQLQCPVYSCPAQASWNANQCVFDYTEIVYSSLYSQIQAVNCSENSYCNSGTLTGNATCQPWPLRYPGEYCTLSTQCLSSICSNSKCSGAIEGAGCVTQYDCDPGLYCETVVSPVNTCQLVRDLGKFCTDSYQCGTYATCVLGICAELYSFSNSATVNPLLGGVGGYSSVCKSGFAALTDATYKCAPAPTSIQTQCSLMTSCMTNLTGYTHPCACGLDGNGYCPRAEGDVNLVNAISAFGVLKSSNIMCNAGTGLSAFCFEGTESLTNYYIYSTNFTMYKNFVTLQNNQECYRNVTNIDYWLGYSYLHKVNPSPTPKKKSFAGMIAITVISLLGLLV